MKKFSFKIVSILLAFIMIISSVPVTKASAWGYNDGSTTYDPTSAGKYGWKTYGFRVTAKAEGSSEEIFCGDYLWPQSNGNPGWMLEDIEYRWPLCKGSGVNMLEGVPAAIKSWLNLNFPGAGADSKTFTCKLEFFGVYTFKADGANISELYYDGIFHRPDESPDSFSSLTSVYDIIKNGYAEIYNAKCGTSLTKLNWGNNNPGAYDTFGTVNITFYASEVCFYATNDRSASSITLRDLNHSDSGNTSSVTGTWYKYCGSRYYWEGKSMSDSDVSSGRLITDVFSEQVGSYVASMRAGEYYYVVDTVPAGRGSVSLEKNNVYYVALLYETADAEIASTVRYVNVDTGRTVCTDSVNVKSSSSTTFTPPALVSGDGKQYVLAKTSDSWGSYQPKFVYGTKAKIASKEYDSVDSYGTTERLSYSGNSLTIPKIGVSDGYAVLFIPVTESDSHTVRVTYYNVETGATVGTDVIPVKTGSNGNMQEINYLCKAPSNSTLDTSKKADITPKVYVAGTKKSEIPFTGSRLIFTPVSDRDHELRVPVKAVSSGTGSGGSGSTAGLSSGMFGNTDLTSRGMFYNSTYGTGLTIPSDMSVNGTITAPLYYFVGTYSTVSGLTKQYPVEFTYSWTYLVVNEAEDGTTTEDRTEMTGSFTVMVTREYGYTTLASNYDYAWLSSAVMSNSALSGSLTASNTRSPYSVNWTNYGDESGHIIEPSYARAVDLGNLGEYEDMFSPDEESYRGVAEGMVGQIRARSDSLVFNGTTVLSGDYRDGYGADIGSFPSAPQVTIEGVSYIPSYMPNGYNASYANNGRVTYRGISGSDRTVTFTSNSITVHTPVYISATVTCDNSKYIQTDNVPGTDFVLVNGASESYGSVKNENISCDFTVQLSNTGNHISSTGYGYNNYTRFGTNQVRFDCDMYVDISADAAITNDVLLPAGTWYSIGTTRVRFYLPAWTEDGTYEMDYRAVAYNGSGSSPSQTTANTSLYNYVATGSKTFAAIGKMYGFTLTEVDSDDWDDVFRYGTDLKRNFKTAYIDGTLALPDYRNFDAKKYYYYTAGTNNELGLTTGRNAKYVLPMIAGSSPKTVNAGVQKAGYNYSFNLSTTGSKMAEEGAKVVIIPSFYWVSSDGTQREPVDLYYSEKSGGNKYILTKVGSTEDIKNVKFDYTDSAIYSIPADELRATAKTLGYAAFRDWAGKYGSAFTYGLIVGDGQRRTYSNDTYNQTYVASQKTTGGRKVKEYLASAGIRDDVVLRTKQTWYFEYRLPSSFHAVSKTVNMSVFAKEHPLVDFTEDIWKSDGYIVVNFDITAYDADGNRYLSYCSGVNSMWKLEGFKAARTDYYGTGFNFSEGDVFMLYVDKTIRNDFTAVLR